MLRKLPFYVTLPTLFLLSCACSNTFRNKAKDYVHMQEGHELITPEGRKLYASSDEYEIRPINTGKVLTEEQIKPPALGHE